MNTRQTEAAHYDPHHDRDDRTVITGESSEIVLGRGRHSFGAHVLELATRTNDPALLETAKGIYTGLETDRPGAVEDANAFIEALDARPDLPRPRNGNGYAGQAVTEVHRFPRPPEPADFRDMPTAQFPTVGPRARFVPRQRLH